MNSIIRYNTKINFIFMNSENSETSDPHRLLLNFTDKTDKRRQINILLYQILVFFIHGKILKNHIRILNSKHDLQHGMKNLDYLMDHILYQMFKIILNIYLKSMGKRLLILQ